MPAPIKLSEGVNHCIILQIKIKMVLLPLRSSSPSVLAISKWDLSSKIIFQDGLWGTAIGFQEKLVLARNLVWRFKLPGGLEGNAPWLKQRKIAVSCKYGHSIENYNHLDRDFLVQLWVADSKTKILREKEGGNWLSMEIFWYSI